MILKLLPFSRLLIGDQNNSIVKVKELLGLAEFLWSNAITQTTGVTLPMDGENCSAFLAKLGGPHSQSGSSERGCSYD